MGLKLKNHCLNQIVYGLDITSSIHISSKKKLIHICFEEDTLMILGKDEKIGVKPPAQGFGDHQFLNKVMWKTHHECRSCSERDTMVCSTYLYTCIPQHTQKMSCFGSTSFCIPYPQNPKKNCHNLGKSDSWHAGSTSQRHCTHSSPAKVIWRI